MASTDGLPQIVEIPFNHVLSRTYPFDKILEYDDFEFSSIDQMFYSVALAQHGMFLEAKEFWSIPRRLSLHQSPHLIRSCVDDHFRKRRTTYSAQWLFSVKEVMSRVILTVLSYENHEFTQHFHRLRKQYGSNLLFVAVTQSPNERLWSCGHAEGELPGWDRDFSGVNLYGEVLNSVYEMYHDGEDLNVPSLSKLLNESVYGNRSFRKTAVILSDSMFKHAKEIEGGSIWYKGGLTCSDLAEYVRTGFGQLSSFKYVLIAAGTNDASLSNKDQERSWQSMRDLLLPLRNHPETYIFFNSGIGSSGWFDKGVDIPLYTQWFREVFEHEFSDCDNIVLNDWSVPKDFNFFLNADGITDSHYFDRDVRHPNKVGTIRMWKAQQAVDPQSRLRLIRFWADASAYPTTTLDKLGELCF